MAAAIATVAGNVAAGVGGNVPTYRQTTELFYKQIAQDKRLFSAQYGPSSPLIPPLTARALHPSLPGWQVRGGGRAAQ